MIASHYRIRKFQENDLPALAEIYRDSITQTAAAYYTKDQVTAWSSFADDAEAFRDWITGATTFVAIADDNSCIGFAGLESHGRISSLFVAPEFSRMGVGHGLLERILNEARFRKTSVITTEASAVSRPLFEKFGFCVTEIEHTVIKSIKVKRYRMQASWH